MPNTVDKELGKPYHYILTFLDSQGYSYTKRITSRPGNLNEREELKDHNLIALIRVEEA